MFSFTRLNGQFGLKKRIQSIILFKGAFLVKGEFVLGTDRSKV